MHILPNVIKQVTVNGGLIINYINNTYADLKRIQYGIYKACHDVMLPNIHMLQVSRGKGQNEADLPAPDQPSQLHTTTQQQQLTITFTQIQNKHALNSTNSAQTHPQRGQHLEPDDVTAAAQLRMSGLLLW